MHAEQRQRTYAALKQQNIHQAIFAKPESIKWLTGIAVPVEVGLNLFAAGFPVVWYDDGQFTLIILDSYAELAAPFDREPDGKVVTYVGYSVEAPIASGKHLLEQFQAVIKPSTTRIGVEREFVSHLIAGQFEHQQLVAIDGWLEPLRMVKTEEELVKLRRSFELTDIGHAAARAATLAGSREIDVWNALYSAIQAAAGCRLPVGNDCVVGYRSPNNIGGWPLDYEIHPGDSLIVDISVIWDGYWSDSCATYFVGERTPEQEKIHKTIQEALKLGISLIRPGVTARGIDQQLRQFIAAAGYPVYPHHTGHGVGVSGHEAPRIVPYSNEILREGMVIMLEPGTYFPGRTGVRLEDALLVTANGSEQLTHHDKS